MIKYLDELKNITSDYESGQKGSQLKKQLSALLSVIDDEIEPEESISYKASDFAEAMIKEKFQCLLENEIIKTGFTQLDNQIVGFQKEELIIIGGRPGMGKTRLMIQLATNMAFLGKCIAFFSLEQSTKQITQILLSNLGQVNMSLFFNPIEYNILREKELTKSLKILKDLSIYMYEKPSHDLTELLYLVRKVVTERKIDVVFIDYLQLIVASTNKSDFLTEAFINCKELKSLAVELGITIVISSGLSRELDNWHDSKRPQVIDLLGGTAIQKFADKILLLYRAEYYGFEIDERNLSTKGRMKLILAQNKNGVICDVDVLALFGESKIIEY